MADKSSEAERWPLLRGRGSSASGPQPSNLDVRIRHERPALPAASNTTSVPDLADIADIAASEASDSEPDDPQNWPAHFKWGVVGLLTFMSFTV